MQIQFGSSQFLSENLGLKYLSTQSNTKDRLEIEKEPPDLSNPLIL